MICQHCKKNIATVSRVEIVGDKKFESHLCQACNAMLFGDLYSKANGDIWAGLFGSAVPKEKVCPVCGTTYADYERTGLLGCASCYDVFRDELTRSIEQIHGKTKHVGKAGENRDEFGLHRRLKTLKEELEIAMREKRYHDAGIINNRIDEVSKILFGGSDDE